LGNRYSSEYPGEKLALSKVPEFWQSRRIYLSAIRRLPIWSLNLEVASPKDVSAADRTVGGVVDLVVEDQIGANACQNPAGFFVKRGRSVLAEFPLSAIFKSFHSNIQSDFSDPSFYPWELDTGYPGSNENTPVAIAMKLL
jgi:hypothetical protein